MKILLFAVLFCVAVVLPRESIHQGLPPTIRRKSGYKGLPQEAPMSSSIPRTKQRTLQADRVCSVLFAEKLLPSLPKNCLTKQHSACFELSPDWGWFHRPVPG